MKTTDLDFQQRDGIEISQRLRPNRHHMGRSHFYVVRETTEGGALFTMFRADAIPPDPVTPKLEAAYMDLILDARYLETVDEDDGLREPNPNHYAHPADYRRALAEWNKKTNYGKF